jgi:hypothetical protein
MVKGDDTLAALNFEDTAEEAVLGLLARIGAVIHHEPRTRADRGVDFILDLEEGGRRHVLAVECKTAGQPRQIREALLQLRLYADQHGGAVPLLVVPYVSEQARRLCNEFRVNYLDLVGNCRVVFGGVFIEREVAQKPLAERRHFRAVFQPRSALVLRRMLREPNRTWRVSELAHATGVSLGHVSNIKKALLDREWAVASTDGFHINRPNELLDAWRDVYQPPKPERFYTTLHGDAFQEKAREAFAQCRQRRVGAVFASFSAARWLSAFGRTSTEFFYADSAAVNVLAGPLRLTPSAEGGNVLIMMPKDSGVFVDKVEAAPSVDCTSPVQTFLDLSVAGDRGREAAEHLRRGGTQWPR